MKLVAGVAIAVLCAAAACSLAVDNDALREDQTGGSDASGGGGAGDMCQHADDCAPPDTRCQVVACVGRTCSYAAAPDGDVTDDTPGDCHTPRCEDGELVVDGDDSDTPASNDECVRGVCKRGPMFEVQTGAECSDGVCDPTGACVACNVAADCGRLDECGDYDCMDHVCDAKGAKPDNAACNTDDARICCGGSCCPTGNSDGLCKPGGRCPS